MQAVTLYLLQITAGGLLTGIVKKLFASKGMIGSVIKLISGIFMMLLIISPLSDIRIDPLLGGLEDLKWEGMQAATDGENLAKEEMAEIITGRTRAYILDKAAALGADLQVSVALTEELPPVPCGAALRGSVSPYAKKVLSEFMEKELGIPMEAQQWTG